MFEADDVIDLAPKNVSSSAIKQYSQRWSARAATTNRMSAFTTSAICDALTRAGLCQPHEVFQFKIMIQFGTGRVSEGDFSIRRYRARFCNGPIFLFLN
jgi:hypothetical protein